MSRSFESVRWNTCVHRLHLGLYSRTKEFYGTHVNSTGKIPSTGDSTEGRTRHPPSGRTASPTHYRLRYSGPRSRRVALQPREVNTQPLGGRSGDRLVDLVIKASASRAEDPGIFHRLSHTSDLKIGTPVATLPGAWCYGVSAETGWPGVSIL